jgi:hypothetical protein
VSQQWFAIIHDRSRTRFAHLFATSVDHPRMKGATTACGVDAYQRFPETQIGFGVYDDAERCPACTEKEHEWKEQAASSGSSPRM